MTQKHTFTKEEVLQAGREMEALEENHRRPWRSDRFLESRGAVRNWEDGNLTVIDVEKYEKFSALIGEIYNSWGRKEYAVKKRLENLEALQNQI